MKTWIPDARNFAYLTWKQVDALPRANTLLVLPTAATAENGERWPRAAAAHLAEILVAMYNFAPRQGA